jgi:hypothetical protein
LLAACLLRICVMSQESSIFAARARLEVLVLLCSSPGCRVLYALVLDICMDSVPPTVRLRQLLWEISCCDLWSRLMLDFESDILYHRLEVLSRHDLRSLHPIM